MRSLRVVMFTAVPVLSAVACQSGTGDITESLAVKCTVATAVSEITTTPTPAPDPTPLPTAATSCPVCRDADGNPLPADKCVVHDDVCHVSGNPGGSAVTPTQQLIVIQPATGSPAIAYYGACDNHGGACANRDYAYSITGTELAVATFSGGTTTVYAVPSGATAVKASMPIFPILPASAFYHNPNVHVVFIDLAGNQVDGYGDMQNDCRVVADDGSSGDIPCWCTLC